ncbi:MAG TPA: alpha/beta hydrolase [Candidatus Saccharimonadales bacterium]|jgi:hypothetical protein
MNAILVPGRPDRDEHYDPKRPSNSEDHWFGWLKRQLILRDIHAVSTEPPFPFRPRYDEWKKEFERFDIEPDTILVGHSTGGGFLVRYLSEHKNLHVAKVALVAPFVNPGNNPASDTADFFEFTMDPDFPARTAGTTVFVSKNDELSVRRTVEILRSSLHGLDIREFADKGHFTLDIMDTPEFPELLAAITDATIRQ